ncbi:MAG: sensor histidine kinase [Gammaproteobacteria bacterium]
MATIKTKQYLIPDQAKKRLRYWLLIFFFAMSLPVYFLLHKVYSQLENESWYRQRTQAEALVERIERKLQEKLQAEQDRPIAEYSFFNVLENPLLQSATVNLSPLAQLPPKTDIPGLVGYFQIDPDGSFHIPALPEIDGEARSGLGGEELAARLELKQRLRMLLVLNNAEKVQSIDQEGGKDKKNDLAAEQQELANDRFDEYLRDAERDLDAAPGLIANKKAAQRPDSDAARKKSLTLSEEKLQQLNIETSLWQQKREQDQIGPYEQSNVASEYRQRSRKEKVKIPDQSLAGAIFNRSQAPPASAANEFEETATPHEQALGDSGQRKAEPAIKQSLAIQQQAQVDILSFESEVSPLRLVTLGGRYLCFYRNAWNGQSRYVQGFIVDEKFLYRLVQPLIDGVENRPLSSLLLVDQGNVLHRFKMTKAESELLLFRRSIAAPFQRMEIIVNTASLSNGSGRYVLDLVSIALALIIMAGFILFYRLGSGQIELAKQQRNFISSVSHELKTPLTSIRMYSEMLRADWVADEARKQGYYDYIYFESERLSRLIGNVLQLARLDNHHKKMQLLEASAAQLLQQVQAKVTAQVDAAKYRLNLLFPENEPTDAEIKVDEDAFFQIMINLVDNAIKFSRQSDNHTIDIGYRIGGRGKELVFYVRDYGPGIDKVQRKKIFKLFYRAGDELTRTQPGTGIGLALVVQLAESMGAKVDQINRSPGAEFQVRFSLT